MAVGEHPTFRLLLRDLDGSERDVLWESVTGEAPVAGDEITAEDRSWLVVEERDGLYVCEPAAATG